MSDSRETGRAGKGIVRKALQTVNRDDEKLNAVSYSIVTLIVTDLKDRRGLKHAWEGIDQDVREEILETWRVLAYDAMLED